MLQIFVAEIIQIAALLVKLLVHF